MQFVLWVTHRIELEQQAKDEFLDYSASRSDSVSFDDRIVYVHDLRKIRVLIKDPKIAFVVIDDEIFHIESAAVIDPIVEFSKSE